MKSGDIETTSVHEPLSLHERTLSGPADPAGHDDEFGAQRQSCERMNEYFDQVIAELLTLLNNSQKEVA
jgi:hypothetical protein